MDIHVRFTGPADKPAAKAITALCLAEDRKAPSMAKRLVLEALRRRGLLVHGKKSK